MNYFQRILYFISVSQGSYNTDYMPIAKSLSALLCIKMLKATSKCSSSLYIFLHNNKLLLFIFQVEDSTGITEDTTHAHVWKRSNLFLEIPSRTLEDSSQESVVIKMPPTPSLTPRKVNFLLTPSPSDARINGSPGPSSTRGKSSLKSLLPKLSFKHRSITSDIEKAANFAPESSSTSLREKPSISRTLSLTKIFSPRINRTSSLPVAHIAHSNPESASVGSLGGSVNCNVSF